MTISKVAYKFSQAKNTVTLQIIAIPLAEKAQNLNCQKLIHRVSNAFLPKTFWYMQTSGYHKIFWHIETKSRDPVKQPHTLLCKNLHFKDNSPPFYFRKNWFYSKGL